MTEHEVARGRPWWRPHRPARRASDARDFWLSVVAVVLMLVAVGWLWADQSRLNEHAAELGTTHTQLVDACNRLQIVRVEDNRSHQADFRSFSADLTMYDVVYRESLAQLRQLPASQRVLERPFLRRLLQAIGTKRVAIHDKTWVPVTLCKQAVALHGSHFLPPKPVPFYVRQPPPSALQLPPFLFK